MARRSASSITCARPTCSARSATRCSSIRQEAAPVAELIALSASEGLLPLTHGALTLAGAAPDRITSVLPFKGKEAAVTKALKAAHGLGFPAPGRALAKGDARILWTGRGQAFLLNADPAPLAGLAALTDQTDAWATLRLTGPAADQALARLVPVDLRPAAFGAGSAIRTGLNHMMAVIARVDDGFDIMVFRSMAATAIHELETVMKSLAARG
ncbi:MAG: sarcosine oxidase subunit gamma [Paracoccaceae bacterium]|nr:sarcosine oxidase subunit gamma [Paracoccaceae bacterium]